MLLIRCSGHPQSQHLGTISTCELVRRAGPLPNRLTYDISAVVGDSRKCRNVEEACVERVWKVSRLEAVTPLFANYPRGSNDGGDLLLPRRNRWSANCKTVRWSFLGTLRLRARDPCLSFAYRSAGLSHSPSRANDLIFHSRAIHMLGA